MHFLEHFESDVKTNKTKQKYTYGWDVCKKL